VAAGGAGLAPIACLRDRAFERPDHPGGAPGGDHPGGEIPGYDGVGPDDCAVTYRNSPDDGHFRPEPDITTDSDRGDPLSLSEDADVGMLEGVVVVPHRDELGQEAVRPYRDLLRHSDRAVVAYDGALPDGEATSALDYSPLVDDTTVSHGHGGRCTDPQPDAGPEVAKIPELRPGVAQPGDGQSDPTAGYAAQPSRWTQVEDRRSHTGGRLHSDYFATTLRAEAVRIALPPTPSTSVEGVETPTKHLGTTLGCGYLDLHLVLYGNVPTVTYSA